MCTDEQLRYWDYFRKKHPEATLEIESAITELNVKWNSLNVLLNKELNYKPGNIVPSTDALNFIKSEYKISLNYKLYPLCLKFSLDDVYDLLHGAGGVFDCLAERNFCDHLQKDFERFVDNHKFRECYFNLKKKFIIQTPH